MFTTEFGDVNPKFISPKGSFGGNIDIDDAATLATGAIVLATSNGSVDFASTINGGQDLTIRSGTGAVGLNGVVGGTTTI